MRAHRVSLMAAGLIVFLVSSVACHADLFNWPTTPVWTAGSPTDGNSQTVDYGPTPAISVTVTNMGGPGMTWGAAPQVESEGSYPFTGGYNAGSGVNGLILQANSQTSNSTYIQLTINFNNPGGATNVSFQLWDIDAIVDGSGNGFIDTIKNLQGTAPGGPVYPTSVTRAVPGYNIISGSGAGLTIMGDTSQPSGAANTTNQGTVNIQFSQPVTSISFQYSNGASGSLNQQTLGVGPITFTPVPEVNSSNAALIICGSLLGFGWFRRRSPRREKFTLPVALLSAIPDACLERRAKD